jgi:hypothetical protein
MSAAGVAASDPREHTKGQHAEKVREQRTVVVKGLGKHVSMSAVCGHMEAAGSIAEVQRVRTTAFVTFTTQRQAAWAVERLNNLELQSSSLQVFLLGGPGWAGPSAVDTAMRVFSDRPPLPAATAAAAPPPTSASVPAPAPSKVAASHIQVSLDSAKRRATAGEEDGDDGIDEPITPGVGFSGGNALSTCVHTTVHPPSPPHPPPSSPPLLFFSSLHA